MDAVPSESTSTLEAFYRQFHDQALRWAVGLVGNREDARDIAQDVIMRVGVRKDLKDPAAFLRRSIVNACRNWHRDAQRRTRRETVAGQMDVVPDLSSSTIELIQALECLPYRLRAALVLRVWLDWPEAEVADALGCRPSTVRVLVHRALRDVRLRLVAEGESR